MYRDSGTDNLRRNSFSTISPVTTIRSAVVLSFFLPYEAGRVERHVYATNLTVRGAKITARDIEYLATSSTKALGKHCIQLARTISNQATF